MDMPIPLDAPDDVKRAKVDELHARLRSKGRGCGTCQACCTIMRVDMEPVEQRHKPERTRCGHQCSAGCKIYDAKPESCSVFMCLWLAMELFEDRMLKEWRPDNVGAVVDVNEVGTITAHLKHENRWMRDGLGADARVLHKRGVPCLQRWRGSRRLKRNCWHLEQAS